MDWPAVKAAPTHLIDTTGNPFQCAFCEDTRPHVHEINGLGGTDGAGNPTVRRFTCAGCGRTFRTLTPIEVREAETARLYNGPIPDDVEMVTTCDDCYVATLQGIIETPDHPDRVRAIEILAEIASK